MVLNNYIQATDTGIVTAISALLIDEFVDAARGIRLSHLKVDALFWKSLLTLLPKFHAKFTSHQLILVVIK